MLRKRMLAIATVAAAAALAAPQLPAFAAPAQSTPAISIAAKSALAVVTGDVRVAWQVKKLGVATLSGTASGGTAGQVIKVFAQQFPYQAAPAQLGQAIPVTGATTAYTMQARPGVATHYQAEVFASASATTPVATSPVVTVYVNDVVSFRGAGPCRQRPVCHQTLHVTVRLPPSALAAERAKRWYVYFGLNLSRTGEPPPPRFLTLGAGHPKVSAVRKISPSELALTISVSFRIGTQGYYWSLDACAKDTEAADGLNLPGRHGCGTAKEISRKRVYLG
ncbi:MAG: hypothetical protein ACR2FU_23255 [Streptosporangiaceae bacterium]